MGYLKIVSIAILAVLGLLVMLQNMDSLTQSTQLRLNLYVWEGQTNPYPMYLLFILAFLLGVFLTSLLGICERFRIRRSIKEGERQKKELETELSVLRKQALNLASPPPNHNSAPDGLKS